MTELSYEQRGALSEVLPEVEYTPLIIQHELVGVVQRALAAGARPPLRYLGAGVTAIVLADAQHRAYKVGRHPEHPHNLLGLDTEAEWLETAKKAPVLKGQIVRIHRYDRALRVIINEEVPHGTPKVYGYDLWTHHRTIAEAMKTKYEWGMPEFKEDSYVWSGNRPVLVDCSVHIRYGQRLLRYAKDIVTGKRPLLSERPSDLIWELESEMGDGRLTAKQIAPVVNELRALAEKTR